MLFGTYYMPRDHSPQSRPAARHQGMEAL